MVARTEGYLHAAKVGASSVSFKGHSLHSRPKTVVQFAIRIKQITAPSHLPSLIHLGPPGGWPRAAQDVVAQVPPCAQRQVPRQGEVGGTHEACGQIRGGAGMCVTAQPMSYTALAGDGKRRKPCHLPLTDSQAARQLVCNHGPMDSCSDTTLLTLPIVHAASQGQGGVRGGDAGGVGRGQAARSLRAVRRGGQRHTGGPAPGTTPPPPLLHSHAWVGFPFPAHPGGE